jgi:hypothetical protein
MSLAGPSIRGPNRSLNRFMHRHGFRLIVGELAELRSPPMHRHDGIGLANSLSSFAHSAAECDPLDEGNNDSTG